MVRITVDDEIRKKLLDATEDIELCDEKGHVLGRFQRATPWNEQVEWEPITPDISPEEIERRLKSYGRTYTTAEVLEQLRKL